MPHSCFVGRCETPVRAASYAGLCGKYRPKRPAELRCRFGCHGSRSIYDAEFCFAGPGRLSLPSPKGRGITALFAEFRDMRST
jgi:hypothetical protein